MQTHNNTFYITTPIYYPSAKLHIGHTYSTTIADAMARFKRLAGYDVFFLTGSDEHGQKIQRAAEAQGITPIAYTDEIVAGFQDLWKRLHISYDDFLRTTEERHEKVVQTLFQKAYDKGDIYKTTYEGWYCTPCETYWTEQKLGDNHTCPDCGRPVERLQEESYFFRMSRYAERWLQFIEEHPDFIQPTSRRNEMIQFVKQGLEDLSVSRTSFDWGVPVPFDPKHVIYVWFDALSNYLTGIGYLDNPEMFSKFWPADVHLVGKEIVRFHSIIWPMILMSVDLPLPKQIYGHGWLIVDGTKMSKSLGNVVDPIPLIETYGADAVRYYLLSDIHLGQDGNFTMPSFIQKINADLANDLGNLLHRTLSMVEKYDAGVVRGTLVSDTLDDAFHAYIEDGFRNYVTHMEAMQLNEGIKVLWSVIGRANKYIDETMPWALAKDPQQADRLATVLYELCDVLRRIAVAASPIIPVAATEIWRQLGLNEETAWSIEGVLTPGAYPAGTQVAKGNPVFPRFELPVDEIVEIDVVADKTVQEVAEDTQAAVGEVDPLKEDVAFEDFARMDIRVARVLTCEKVKKSKKLLHMTLDIGGGVTRTVVSGIALHYTPEEMVGKHVLYLANLAPKKLMGIESQGMVLAASDREDHLVVPTVPTMVPGSVVR